MKGNTWNTKCVIFLDVCLGLKKSAVLKCPGRLLMLKKTFPLFRTFSHDWFNLNFDSMKTGLQPIIVLLWPTCPGSIVFYVLLLGETSLLHRFKCIQKTKTNKQKTPRSFNPPNGFSEQWSHDHSSVVMLLMAEWCWMGRLRLPGLYLWGGWWCTGWEAFWPDPRAIKAVPDQVTTQCLLDDTKRKWGWKEGRRKYMTSSTAPKYCHKRLGKATDEDEIMANTQSNKHRYIQ